MMAAKVNYGDNLFYIIALSRSLRAGLQLEIDPDYFRSKMLDDLIFLHRTLESLHETLHINTFLIDRNEHLRELMRAKRGFADLLSEILNDELPFARHLAEFRAKFTGIREQHVGDLADIQASMNNTHHTDEPQNVVSEDEYKFLFQQSQEEAE
jgi:hypothetical protein